MALNSKGTAPREGGPSNAAILSGCGTTNSGNAQRVQLSRRAEIIGRRFGPTAATADLGEWQLLSDVVGRVLSKVGRSVNADGLTPEPQLDESELAEALE